MTALNFRPQFIMIILRSPAICQIRNPVAASSGLTFSRPR